MRSSWLGLSSVVVVVVAFTVPAPAGAADPREGEARTKCLAGDVARGVELLAQLYVETRQSAYIYNQARCYQQNGQATAAIQRFREYLRTERNVAPDERERVEGYIRELEKDVEREQARAAPPPPLPIEPARPVEPVAPPVTVTASAPVTAPAWRRPAAYVAAGAAGLSLAGAVAFHVTRERRAADFNRTCYPTIGEGCDRKESRVNAARNLAIVGYAATALLSASATYLFLSSAEGAPAYARACTVTVPAGLTCGARF